MIEAITLTYKYMMSRESQWKWPARYETGICYFNKDGHIFIKVERDAFSVDGRFMFPYLRRIVWPKK